MTHLYNLGKLLATLETDRLTSIENVVASVSVISNAEQIVILDAKIKVTQYSVRVLYMQDRLNTRLQNIITDNTKYITTYPNCDREMYLQAKAGIEIAQEILSIITKN